MISIKPLVWTTYDDKYDGGRTYYGEGIFGHWYAVSREKAKMWGAEHTVGRENVHLGWFESLEAAKAAAQADYEHRILSALSQPHPADERVVEAAREIAARAYIAVGNPTVAKLMRAGSADHMPGFIAALDALRNPLTYGRR